MNNKMSKTQREALIWKLMNAFPASLTNVTAGVIDAYVEGTWDCSEEAILRSIEQYRSGRVEEHRGSFAPSAPDFARNVRMWVMALDVLAGTHKVERLVSYPMGELPPPPLEALGPISIDMGDGRGKIDLRGKTLAEKEAIMAGGPVNPDETSPAFRPALKRMS